MDRGVVPSWETDSYCVYDRFGYGLSDSTDAPISLRKSAEALKYALVDEMGLKGPFLVVGFVMVGWLRGSLRGIIAICVQV